MKTLEEIIVQTPIFLHNWSNKDEVLRDFADYYYGYDPEEEEKKKEEIEKLGNPNVLFASYGTDNYSGEAFVLFEKDGKLYEVNGSHCSCMGLEHQWLPEEVNLESIRNRLVDGKMGQDNYSDNEYAEELKQFLGIEEELTKNKTW